MKKFLKFLFCVILIAISIGLQFVGNGYKIIPVILGMGIIPLKKWLEVISIKN